MKFKKTIRAESVLLILIVFLGLILRFRHWPDFLAFDFEKARDLIASMNIFINRKITLLGPTSEVDGIFHGPLYYYLIGFFYFIFKGDPRAGSIVSFFFNLSSVFVLFYIGKRLFNKNVGLISAFIYAVSFEAISYAFWLSNPGPSVPFLFLMFYFFYKFCIEKGKYLAPALFCLGIAIQFQILNVIFIPSLAVLYFLTGRPKISLKNLILSLTVFVIPLLSFILFEFRHHFLMLNAFIKNYFPAENSDKLVFMFNFPEYLDRFFVQFSNVFLPTQKLIPAMILIVTVVTLVVNIIRKGRKTPWTLLAVWMFSTFPIFLINSQMSKSSAAFICVSGGMIITVAYIIDKLSSNRRNWLIPFFLLPILFSNLYAIDHFLTGTDKRLFDSFQGMFYKNDMAIINYIYKEAGNDDFKVDTVTSPLFISPVWDYLLVWHSKKNNLNPPKRGDERVQFLIIEPYVDLYYKEQAIKKKEPSTKLTTSEVFGKIAVQKWLLK